MKLISACLASALCLTAFGFTVKELPDIGGGGQSPKLARRQDDDPTGQPVRTTATDLLSCTNIITSLSAKTTMTALELVTHTAAVGSAKKTFVGAPILVGPPTRVVVRYFQPSLDLIVQLPNCFAGSGCHKSLRLYG
jgi:hypothetical protein